MMTPMPSPSPATIVTIYDVLDQIRKSATSEYDKGDRFERLMVTFLRTDPTYADQFTEVWRWKDWPGRDGKVDTGIDLVAVDRLTGGNVAIQCKFYAQNHHVSKADLDGFLAASGTAQFTRRIIVSTGADWGSNAEAVMHNQTIPVTRIGMAELASSSVDWSAYEISTPETMPTLGKNTVRPYQRKAIDDVLAGFEEHDRGKLIMACGTGKTYTSLRLAEELVGAGGRVLFLVPSISLLSQTVPAWANNAQVPLRMLGVCSDPKASKANASTEDISSVDMPLPATTNVDTVAVRLRDAAAETDRMTVVFSTYQSIQVVSDAIKASELDGFDLIVCDEAHRTTGVTLAGAKDLGTGGLNHTRDLVGHEFGVLVLPDAQHCPARRREQGAHALISLSVHRDLVRPEGGVAGRRAVVIGAAMPEAAINEDGDLRAREEEISRRPDAGFGSRVHPIAEPRRVYEATNSHLWLGVGAPIRAHDRAHRRCARPTLTHVASVLPSTRLRPRPARNS